MYKLWVLINHEIYYEGKYTEESIAKRALSDMVDSINEILSTINGVVIIILMKNHEIIVRYYLKNEATTNASNP